MNDTPARVEPSQVVEPPARTIALTFTSSDVKLLESTVSDLRDRLQQLFDHMEPDLLKAGVEVESIDVFDPDKDEDHGT